MSGPADIVGNPGMSWRCDYKGRTLVRWQGKVIYDGPTADMPPEVRELADQMTVSIHDVLPTLGLVKN